MKIHGISEEDRAYFQGFYTQHNVVGLLEEGDHEYRVILKMKPGYKGWTPYGTARDCGDHLILARWSRYDSVDKKTMQIFTDVEDR